MDAVRAMADAARPLYGGWTNLAMAYYVGQILMHKDIGVDRAFEEVLAECPIGAMGTLESAAGQHAYLYQFNRVVPGKGADALGAFHALEVPYVFNTFDDVLWRWLPVTQTDRNLSWAMETYWTNFAKTGNPNATGVPDWPAWTNDSEPYMEFDVNGQPKAQKDFSPIFCHLGPDRLKEQFSGK
jgi:carboxylesterase type B